MCFECLPLQGSLLPKRIDSIAVINHGGAQLQATALKAEDVLDGLRGVVNLLKSRLALMPQTCAAGWLFLPYCRWLILSAK